MESYGDEIYDIVKNSPSRIIAYSRGFALGGPVLAMLCATWWDNISDDGTPPPIIRNVASIALK